MLATTLLLLPHLSAGVCDGNPHGWDRVRRCDQFDAACPELFAACGKCEGIGGIPKSDKPDDFRAPPCEPAEDPATPPAPPTWPVQFTNARFFETQIFVKHDPLCIAQIPAMTSNGTHCYKEQQGTFRYDASATRSLRIDYLKSRSGINGVNMTEYFYHEGTNVHPDITSFGILAAPFAPLGGICPCINVSTGIVSPTWTTGALYIGRERMGVEYLWTNGSLVDHFVKGPHHVWTDVQTGNIVRLWQPFNGLEIFDPAAYEDSVDTAALALPKTCQMLDSHCIQAFPDASEVERVFGALAAQLTLAAQQTTTITK